MKHYLVTGGRSPLALSLCEVLGNRGDSTTLLTRTLDDEFVKVTQDIRGCHAVAVDLGDADSIAQVLSGHIQSELSGAVLIHRYRGEDLLQSYAIDVVATAHIIDHVGLSPVSDRSVVVYTSPGARVVLRDQPLAYHLSKGSQASLVRYMAKKWAATGMRVNGISPGAFIDKPRSRAFLSGNPSLLTRISRLTPLGRQATLGEIGAVATFLLDDQSSFVTGQILEVDGGTSLLDQSGLEPPRE